MSEDVKMKPCPFCGGEATRTTMRKFKYVSCENSDCSMVVEAGALFSREDEAITAWNTRAGEHAAYERGKAEERARIVEDIERMVNEHLEEARKTEHKDMEKSHRQLARAYGYIANYLRGTNQTE